MRVLYCLFLVLASGQLAAADQPWSVEGKFATVERLEFTITNTLDIDRENIRGWNPHFTYANIDSFAITIPRDSGFEFLLASAWSEGAVYNTPESFTAYIRKTALEYNNPLQIRFAGKQEKE